MFCTAFKHKVCVQSTSTIPTVSPLLVDALTLATSEDTGAEGNSKKS